MNDLQCHTEPMLEAGRTLRNNRAMIQPGRPVPSIAMCGSDDVIRAFVQAFQMIRLQDANAYSSWADLGDQLQRTTDELGRVDASLAGSFR